MDEMVDLYVECEGSYTYATLPSCPYCGRLVGKSFDFREAHFNRVKSTDFKVGSMEPAWVEMADSAGVKRLVLRVPLREAFEIGSDEVFNG